MSMETKLSEALAKYESEVRLILEETFALLIVDGKTSEEAQNIIDVQFSRWMSEHQYG